MAFIFVFTFVAASVPTLLMFVFLPFLPVTFAPASAVVIVTPSTSASTSTAVIVVHYEQIDLKKCGRYHHLRYRCAMAFTTLHRVRALKNESPSSIEILTHHVCYFEKRRLCRDGLVGYDASFTRMRSRVRLPVFVSPFGARSLLTQSFNPHPLKAGWS